jgi:hypothetical protein
MPLPMPEGFGDVKEGFELLPRGTYTVEVADAEERTSGSDAKEPGKPYIWLEMHIQDEGYEDRRVWTNLSFASGALGMTKANLRVLGVTDEEFNDPDFELDVERFIGQRVRAVVTVKFNKQTQEEGNQVRRLIPLSDEEAELPEG